MVIFLLLTLFVLGTIVGSLLNVCIYRIPLEKSILWPGSRCGHCLQQVRWYDNIPLVSYWLLRGRCRTCGSRFSLRYFLIELFTGLCFTGLFYLEIIQNAYGMDVIAKQWPRMQALRLPTWEAWIVFGYHAVFVSFLIVATFCDLDHREIPLSLTVTGTVLGLVGATLFPWPWPNPPAGAVLPNLKSAIGLYPWPVWWPLPAWLPAGSWQLGLLTGLAGLLVGTLMLRAVRFLFSTGLGVEALGLGDADLMMMAGSFLGWQPLVVAFFLSVVPGLLFAGVHLLRRWHTARSNSTLKVRVSLNDHQPALEVRGELVPLDEFGMTCARLVPEAHLTRLLLDSGELEDSAATAVDQIKEAAHQAGIHRVRDITNEAPPRLLGRVLRRLFPYLRTRSRPAIKVEPFFKNGLVGLKVDDKETAREQLPATLRELGQGQRDVEVLVNVHNLEKWVDRVVGNLRMAARQAGINEIIRQDNAIPFGPSLAVGLVLSLLAWPWIVYQAHLAFIMFNSWLVFGFAGISAFLMLAASYAIRVVRLMRR